MQFTTKRRNTGSSVILLLRPLPQSPSRRSTSKARRQAHFLFSQQSEMSKRCTILAALVVVRKSIDMSATFSVRAPSHIPRETRALAHWRIVSQALKHNYPTGGCVLTLCHSLLARRMAPCNDPCQAIRLDETGHWPRHDPINVSQSRCRLCRVGRSRVKCEKCGVYLCLNSHNNCFTLYHSK